MFGVNSSPTESTLSGHQEASVTDAPGWPGISPRWTSSAKSGVGTALSPVSRVWFTLSHGILDEIYYPRVDQACTRDFGLIVTGDDGFFAEEKRDCQFEIAALEDGVPAFRLVNTHTGGRFRIIKHVLTDHRADVVVQSIRLEVLSGPPLRLFALLAPHLVNGGGHNTAWIGTYKGHRMLFAEGDGTRLALGCSMPFLACSVGFVGFSDGWQMLQRSGWLTEEYDRAADGNVALTAEIASPEIAFRLALGFGRSAPEAGFRVRASLQTPFERQTEEFAIGWRSWQAQLHSLDRKVDGHNVYRVSTAVLRCHESPTFPGGLIASLSIPWGGSKGDDDLGGYHLVWPRDLAQTAGAFLACGAHDEVLRVLRYLRAIQEDDGSWPQNCWLDGTPYWHGVQLDECAFPMLLLDMAWRKGAIARPVLPAYWPMVARAAGFVIRHGPRTGQDRWEENAGYTPFTLAVQVAALLAAADLAVVCEVDDVADFLRDTADAWNEQIEDWIYVTDTRLAREVGVSGYYVRIAPEVPGEARAELDGLVEVRNRFAGTSSFEADELVSTDALALVRFGLRSADDPRITATVKVIDHVLMVDLPYGPGWRRYNGDGYGEHDDGGPYDGTGVGRVWPLLAGERAHYELAAGRRAEAERLLSAMETGASPGKLLPEQVWDGPPIPERELESGQPSGSAMPLVWAHAEHIKLLRSLADAAVFDLPPQPVRRYCARSVSHVVGLGGLTGGRRMCRLDGHCDLICSSRRWCIGAPMGGRPGATCEHRIRGSASTQRRYRQRVSWLAGRLHLPGLIWRRRRGSARTTPWR
jgi:glucoamylase